MSSPDERFDGIIDEVAQAMTAGAPPDIRARVADRIAAGRRHGTPLLVPAIAAAAVVVAAVVFVVMRSPGRVQPREPAATVARHTEEPARGAQSGSETAIVQHPASGNETGARRAQGLPRGTQNAALGTPQPAARTRFARMPLPPPFVTDLSPAPLAVAPVRMPPIETPGSVDVPALEVDPIPIPPVEDKGGSR